jgi:syntaxin 6
LADVQMAVNLEEKKSHDGDLEARPIHGVDQALYERQSLVQTSRDRIERAKLEANSASVKAKLLSDERAMRRRRGKRDDGSDMGAPTSSHVNDDMIANGQARASLLMQHQDETLDVLDAAVSRVGDMAVAIGEEINDQNKMLDEMTTDLENVEDELGLVMGKLAKFLKTKNSWQLGTIMILMATVVILFFLVLYT